MAEESLLPLAWFWSVLLLEEMPNKAEEPPLPLVWFWSDLLLEEMPAMAKDTVREIAPCVGQQLSVATHSRPQVDQTNQGIIPRIEEINFHEGPYHQNRPPDRPLRISRRTVGPRVIESQFIFLSKFVFLQLIMALVRVESYCNSFVQYSYPSTLLWFMSSNNKRISRILRLMHKCALSLHTQEYSRHRLWHYLICLRVISFSELHVLQKQRQS